MFNFKKNKKYESPTKSTVPFDKSIQPSEKWEQFEFFLTHILKNNLNSDWTRDYVMTMWAIFEQNYPQKTPFEIIDVNSKNYRNDGNIRYYYPKNFQPNLKTLYNHIPQPSTIIAKREMDNGADFTNCVAVLVPSGIKKSLNNNGIRIDKKTNEVVYIVDETKTEVEIEHKIYFDINNINSENNSHNELKKLLIETKGKIHAITTPLAPPPYILNTNDEIDIHDKKQNIHQTNSFSEAPLDAGNNTLVLVDGDNEKLKELLFNVNEDGENYTVLLIDKEEINPSFFDPNSYLYNDSYLLQKSINNFLNDKPSYSKEQKEKHFQKTSFNFKTNSTVSSSEEKAFYLTQNTNRPKMIAENGEFKDSKQIIPEEINKKHFTKTNSFKGGM
ncbi:MAG: hypothetical protein ACRC4M_04155 [Mycoplasma sp.]